MSLIEAAQAVLSEFDACRKASGSEHLPVDPLFANLRAAVEAVQKAQPCEPVGFMHTNRRLLVAAALKRTADADASLGSTFSGFTIALYSQEQLEWLLAHAVPPEDMLNLREEVVKTWRALERYAGSERWREPMTHEEVDALARGVLKASVLDGEPAARQLAIGIVRAVERHYGIGVKLEKPANAEGGALLSNPGEPANGLFTAEQVIAALLDERNACWKIADDLAERYYNSDREVEHARVLPCEIIADAIQARPAPQPAPTSNG